MSLPDYERAYEINADRVALFVAAARVLNEAYASAWNLKNEMILGPEAQEGFAHELSIVGDALTTLETLTGRAYIHACCLRDNAQSMGPVEI